jgi:hypothetical protein
MTIQEIASRLHELCQQGQSGLAHDELFAPTATSTEKNMQGETITVNGMEAIKEKGRNFQEHVEEIHGGYAKEPAIYGNYIFMEMGLDATMKGMGRMNMKEMCQYEVKDGKIISERFFY